MPRYVAFLRAINVGGRTVRKESLIEIFEGLGFTGVGTFIASGNVFFEARSKNVPRLVCLVETQLESSLGFSVSTFIRSEDELTAIVAHRAFTGARLRSAAALNVLFLSSPLSNDQAAALARMKTEIDEFHVHGTEVHWLCLKRQSESTFSNTAFERAVKAKTTIRGIDTLRKMLATREPPGA